MSKKVKEKRRSVLDGIKTEDCDLLSEPCIELLFLMSRFKDHLKLPDFTYIEFEEELRKEELNYNADYLDMYHSLLLNQILECLLTKFIRSSSNFRVKDLNVVMVVFAQRHFPVNPFEGHTSYDFHRLPSGVKVWVLLHIMLYYCYKDDSQDVDAWWSPDELRAKKFKSDKDTLLYFYDLRLFKKVPSSDMKTVPLNIHESYLESAPWREIYKEVLHGTHYLCIANSEKSWENIISSYRKSRSSNDKKISEELNNIFKNIKNEFDDLTKTYNMQKTARFKEALKKDYEFRKSMGACRTSQRIQEKREKKEEVKIDEQSSEDIKSSLKPQKLTRADRFNRRQQLRSFSPESDFHQQFTPMSGPLTPSMLSTTSYSNGEINETIVKIETADLNPEEKPTISETSDVNDRESTDEYQKMKTQNMKKMSNQLSNNLNPIHRRVGPVTLLPVKSISLTERKIPERLGVPSTSKVVDNSGNSMTGNYSTTARNGGNIDVRNTNNGYSSPPSSAEKYADKHSPYNSPLSSNSRDISKRNNDSNGGGVGYLNSFVHEEKKPKESFSNSGNQPSNGNADNERISTSNISSPVHINSHSLNGRMNRAAEVVDSIIDGAHEQNGTKSGISIMEHSNNHDSRSQNNTISSTVQRTAAKRKIDLTCNVYNGSVKQQNCDGRIEPLNKSTNAIPHTNSDSGGVSGSRGIHLIRIKDEMTNYDSRDDPPLKLESVLLAIQKKYNDFYDDWRDHYNVQNCIEEFEALMNVIFNYKKPLQCEEWENIKEHIFQTPISLATEHLSTSNKFHIYCLAKSLLKFNIFAWPRLFRILSERDEELIDESKKCLQKIDDVIENYLKSLEERGVPMTIQNKPYYGEWQYGIMLSVERE